MLDKTVLENSFNVIKYEMLKGKTVNDKWYVRPLSWEGIWRKDGKLDTGNVLFSSENEEECDNFIMNHELLKLVEENPNLPIVTMTHYDVCGGDNGYWLGKMESVEVKEYAINEWSEDYGVVFKDSKEDIERLVEFVAEYKYKGTEEDCAKAEKDVNEMWKKAIVIRIGL